MQPADGRDLRPDRSADAPTITRRTPRLGFVRRRAGRSAGLWTGIALFSAIVVLCIVVPIASPYSTDELGLAFQGPSWSHPFGTDSVGRDLFTRTFAGGRIDLLVAAIGVGLSLTIGTLLGTLSGVARRGWIDSVLMRVVDAVIAFPFVILILALIVVIGPDTQIGPLPAGLPATFIAIVAAGWAWYARLARGQTLALRDRDYVTAARLLGFSTPRIIVRHLVPTVFRVNAAYAVGDAILIVIVVASLAFLGAGVQPPTPEWGGIMFEGRGYLETAWWITVFPGIVLALTGLALSLVTDALLAPTRGRR